MTKKKKIPTMINDVYKEGQFRKCQNSVVKQGNCKGSKITVFKSCSLNLTLEMFLNTQKFTNSGTSHIFPLSDTEILH